MSSASTGGTEGSSPASSPASATSLAMAAPKYGTLVPNRIFVGGISASTSEAELAQLFSSYGNVKATKIISDRAGVSKGYGFVTFETEEEAKRLQQESECIVLRERKLNIAPAIKKQPFNRSFDAGSGSPPAVPTSTYYYTNGMGLAYQNGMTFYNAGAPAPATPVAPPADPATLYQATSVFGPQTTAGHQTFAPMMYPCPAPSLYVPQQYQYSPMPYEPYYTGAAPAGAAPQYLYATGNSQSAGNGGASGSGGGANGTGATSPPAGPPPPPPAIASLPAPQQTHHFYAPAAPPPHHHPQVPPGPPQPQLDHLYYSFAAGPPPHPPPHASMALADQQLLLYAAADPNCQPQQTNDGPSQQQESCSSDPGTEPGDVAAVAASAVAAQMHCRTIVYHPAATVYIPHSHAASPQFHPSPPIGGGGSGSLLPTPTSTVSHAPPPPPPPHHHYHHHHHHSLQSNVIAPKLQTIVSQHHHQHQQHQQRDFQKSSPSGAGGGGGGYNSKSQNLSIALISSGVHKAAAAAAAAAAIQAHNKYAGVSSDFQQKFTANVISASRFSGNHHNHNHHHHQHQYAKQRSFSSNSSPCGGATGPSASYFPAQRSGYGGSHKSINLATGASSFVNGFGYPSVHKEHRRQSYDSVRTGRNSSSRERNSNNGGSGARNNAASNKRASENDNHSSNKNYNSQDSQNADSTVSVQVTEKSSSPPPAPYSPMTRPLPILSPPVPQVQFYATSQNRYQSSSSSSSSSQQQQQQQAASTQRRYTVAPASQSGGRKPSEKYTGGSSTTSQSGSSMLRQQQQQQQKYKPNGLTQVVGSGGLNKSGEDNLGGAGDAPPGVGRLPITPPETPRSVSHPVDQNQIGDTCSHQMQALSL